MPGTSAGNELARTLHELAHYPQHEPDRAKDPYYRVFDRTRHHLIDVLAVPCWIGGASAAQIKAGLPPEHLCHGCTGLELHHNPLEYAGLSEIDWRRFAAEFPTLGIHSDADFLAAAEGEGNATILCSLHHRAPYQGVHSITYPLWVLQRYARPEWRFTEPRPVADAA